jgi:hypothetical protein
MLLPLTLLLVPADKSPVALSIETCGNRAILQARLALFFLLLHQIVAFDDELVLARRLKLRNKTLAFAGTAIVPRCGSCRRAFRAIVTLGKQSAASALRRRTNPLRGRVRLLKAK